MRLRFGAGVCVAACTASLCVAGAVADEAPPTFWVESSQLEVGPVTAGSTAVATFIFHNEGDGDIEILRAAPS